MVLYNFKYLIFPSQIKPYFTCSLDSLFYLIFKFFFNFRVSHDAHKLEKMNMQYFSIEHEKKDGVFSDIKTSFL